MPGAWIALPAPGLAGVDLRDGVDEKEASDMASTYLRHYITSCGMPSDLKQQGDYWVAKLQTGYSGTHFSGTLWISTKTGDVLLQLPPRGLQPYEVQKIELMKQVAEKWSKE